VAEPGASSTQRSDADDVVTTSATCVGRETVAATAVADLTTQANVGVPRSSRLPNRPVVTSHLKWVCVTRTGAAPYPRRATCEPCPLVFGSPASRQQLDAEPLGAAATANSALTTTLGGGAITLDR
jgi:hypothetical protein